MIQFLYETNNETRVDVKMFVHLLDYIKKSVLIPQPDPRSYIFSNLITANW